LLGGVFVLSYPRNETSQCLACAAERGNNAFVVGVTQHAEAVRGDALGFDLE
jgi:hypothetical protein